MISNVSLDSFRIAFEAARSASDLIANATSPVSEVVAKTARYYLSDDHLSGFAIREDGELVGVFSLVKGRGDSIVAAAIENGAKYLDCFDGYLPRLYSRHGFTEVKREPNWTPGGPDVVYMVLA